MTKRWRRNDREPWSIPLFPLRTVLFPGGILPLKVFENRYVEMTKACMKDERPFGVCLITEGEEVAKPGVSTPQFEVIGTLARITNFDMPQLGILHIQTLGLERFNVHRHSVEASGLIVGEVTTLPAEPTLPMPDPYAPLVKILEAIAARVGPENFPSDVKYDDATWVGYRLAELLPLPLSIKQRMLEVNDANVRLAAIRQFLERQGVV